VRIGTGGRKEERWERREGKGKEMGGKCKGTGEKSSEGMRIGEAEKV